MKYDAILVDIGNVLMTFDFLPAMKELAPSFGDDFEAPFELLMEKKDDFERGLLSETEYITWASDILRFTGTHDEFKTAWNSIFTPNQLMWNDLKISMELGLKHVIFSNTNAIHAPWLMKNCPLLPKFDGYVFSHQVGAIKPQAPIYQYAIEQFNLDPSKTLYIDDLLPNIIQGQEWGLHSHRYDPKNHSAFKRWFDEKLDA